VHLASSDAYAAREALASTKLRSSITAQDERCLAALVESSGLGRGFIPAGLLDDFAASVQAAGDQLRLLLESSGAETYKSHAHR
jgi:hypothetical protein